LIQTSICAAYYLKLRTMISAATPGGLVKLKSIYPHSKP
jgi:hypothetical protein